MSAAFRLLGWKVIAVEPNPAYLPYYTDMGLDVLQYACGAEDRDGMDFSVVDSEGADYKGGNISFESFSSLAIKPEYRGMKEELNISHIEVDVRRADTILEQHAPEVSELDIVSVDVEGWELEALGGLDFRRYRPKVLIVENMFRSPDYTAFFAERGYVCWRHLAPNEIYVRRDLLTLFERLKLFFGALPPDS